MFYIITISRQHSESFSENTMKYHILKLKPYSTEALSLLKQGVEAIVTWDTSLSDILNEAECEGSENIATLDTNTHLACTIQIGDEFASFSKRFGFTAQIMGLQTFSAHFCDLDEWDWNEHEQLNEVTQEVFEYIKANQPHLLMPTEKHLDSATEQGLISHIESELNITYLTAEDRKDYNLIRSKMDFSTLEIERVINHDEWFDEFCDIATHEENVTELSAITHITETYRFNNLELVVNTPHGVSFVGDKVVITDSVIQPHYDVRIGDSDVSEELNAVVGKMLIEHISINRNINMSKFEERLIGEYFKLQLLDFLNIPPSDLWAHLNRIIEKA